MADACGILAAAVTKDGRMPHVADSESGHGDSHIKGDIPSIQLTAQINADLSRLDLTVEEMSAANIRRAYRSRALLSRADLDLSASEDLKALHAAHDRLLEELAMVASEEPINASSAPERMVRRNIAIHHPNVSALPWQRQEINEKISADVSHKLAPLAAYFNATFEEIVPTLRALKEGNCYRISIRHRCPSVPWATTHRTTFHGTSWFRLLDILPAGFTPSYGPGRHSAYRKFGVDLPVVYTCPFIEDALRHPISMTDSKHNPCGEILAWDLLPIRLVLELSCDVAARRIKLRNHPDYKTDTYLHEDLSIDAIVFLGRTPTAEQFALYEKNCPEYVKHFSMEPDPYNNGIHLPCHLPLYIVSLLRSTMTSDLRNINELKDATLELLSIRMDFLHQHSLPSNHSLNKEEMRLIWKKLGELYDREDDPIRRSWEENELGPGKRNQKRHQRFHLWIRLFYGRTEQIRNLFRDGLESNLVIGILALDAFKG